RRVDSTAPRISSTARSPASTSTPERVYDRRSSATCRHRLLQHELAALAVVGQLECREHPRDRDVTERIGADEVADLVDGHVGRDELRLDLGVDAVEARVEDRRCADPDVDLRGAGPP